MNVTTTDIDNVLRQLAFGPELVVPLVREVPPAILKRRPAPGVWSAHEHACHLPAVQPLMLERLDHMLSNQISFNSAFSFNAGRPRSHWPSNLHGRDLLLRLEQRLSVHAIPAGLGDEAHADHGLRSVEDKVRRAAGPGTAPGQRVDQCGADDRLNRLRARPVPPTSIGPSNSTR